MPPSSSARPVRRDSWCRRRGSATAFDCCAATASASTPNSCGTMELRADHHLQRGGDRARLLEDLLLHVVAVGAELDCVGRQLALVHRPLAPCARSRRGCGSRRWSAPTTSPSSRYTMRRVTCSSAEASEAAKFSPSPRPSSSGAPLRATTSLPGPAPTPPRSHRRRSARSTRGASPRTDRRSA